MANFILGRLWQIFRLLKKIKNQELAYNYNNFSKNLYYHTPSYFFFSKSAIYIWQTQNSYPGFLSKGVAGQTHGCWSNHTGQIFQVHISINHCCFNQELQKYIKILPSVGFKWYTCMNFENFITTCSFKCNMSSFYLPWPELWFCHQRYIPSTDYHRTS